MLCLLLGQVLDIAPTPISAVTPAPWSQCAGNPQHTALSKFPSQHPSSIKWSAPVDLNPQYSGNDLLAHYGTPLATTLGTVITPVKTGASDNFEFRAYTPTGTLLYTVSTDYTVPAHR